MAQFEHAIPYVANYIWSVKVAIYIAYNEAVISHSAALVLHALEAGDGYGFSVMELTGLPSGTVYPSLRRLEREGLIRSHWEKRPVAEQAQRPPRKYYRLTRAGRDVLGAARSRYPLLAKLAAEVSHE